MLLALLVVEQDALLQSFSRDFPGDAGLRCLRETRRYFETVEGMACVSVGVAGEQFERFMVGFEMKSAEAALLIRERAFEQGEDLLIGKRAQRIDAAAGEQRGDDFEGRIFCCRSDEADGAALDVGKKGVLLRFVEAMNLVDEEDGA